MDPLKTASRTILVILAFASSAHSADDTPAPSEFAWLAAKTHLTTEVVVPSLSFAGQASDDVVERATFRDIRVTAKGGSCEAVFERGGVKFNDFGDGEFLQPPAIEVQQVSLRALSEIDRRGEGRRIYAVDFPNGKFLNRVYIVFSPGPVSRDYLLVVGGKNAPQTTGGRPEQSYTFKHIVPLLSRGQPNLLTAVSRRDMFGGTAVNVESPDGAERSTISIGGRIGTAGWLIDDRNSVGRDTFGDIQFSTLVGFGRQPFVLQERTLKDPTSRDRSIVELVPTQNPGVVKSRQFSLVLDAKSSGADRLLIRTDGRLSNVEAFQDDQRTKFLLSRMAVAKSAADSEVVDRAHELVGSGVYFNIKNGHIAGATVHEAGVVPSLLNLFPSLPGLRQLQFTNCRNKSFATDVESLRQLANLESLSFYVTPISDPVLVYVGQLPKLKYLRIYDELPHGTIPSSVPHVTDAGLQHVTKLKELTTLELYGPGISDEGLHALESLPQLSELNLHLTRATMGGAVKFTKGRPKLRLEMQTLEPRIDSSSEVRAMSVGFDSPAAFSNPGQGAVLEGNLVGDAEIRGLVALTDLRQVRISGTDRVTERGISELSALPNLENLSLPHLKQLTNRGVSAIAKLQKLKQLSLWYCEQVDDQSVPDLGQLKTLTKLDTRGTKISQDGRKRLQTLLPNCVLEE